MIWKLIQKDFRENYITSTVLVGVITVISVYSSLRKTLTPSEMAIITFVIAGLGLVLLLFYSIYRGFSCIRKEKEKNTLEFLMSLPAGGLEVVGAKFLAFFFEAFLLALTIYVVSTFPPLRGLAGELILPHDFGRLMLILLYVVFAMLLGAFFFFIVFQLFEILNLSLKVKGFLWRVILFFAFVYFTGRFFIFAKSIFRFLPVKVYEISIFNEVVNWGADYQGLAAGVLVSLTYLGVSILLYNKRVEV
jgi:ABC-type Na+ efflux pump permease subunit